MKLDTDKASAMTPEFIEQQRPLFEAWQSTGDAILERAPEDNCYYDDIQTNCEWHAWLAARSAGLSQEPVAWVLNKELESRETTCKAHLWFSDPVNSGWAAIYTAPPAPVIAEPVQKELESMTRMFNAACFDLGLINKALGLDPDDGGAEPILSAIEELKTKLSSLPAAPAAPLSDAKEDGNG